MRESDKKQEKDEDKNKKIGEEDKNGRKEIGREEGGQKWEE